MPRNYKSQNKPCFYCYKTGHSTDVKCTSNGIIACRTCFKMNVFTKKCNCKHPKMPHPPQELRLIGKPTCPKIYLDLLIHDTVIPCLLNTSITRSRVNIKLANWLQSVSTDSIYHNLNTIFIKTSRKGFLLKIPCTISETQLEHIELGTEFMTAAGFVLTIEGASIESNKSPILSDPYEIEYVYNLENRGRDLRNYLTEKKFFLKKGRITRPTFSTYSNLIVTVKRQSDSNDEQK